MHQISQTINLSEKTVFPSQKRSPQYLNALPCNKVKNFTRSECIKNEGATDVNPIKHIPQTKLGKWTGKNTCEQSRERKRVLGFRDGVWLLVAKEGYYFFFSAWIWFCLIFLIFFKRREWRNIKIFSKIIYLMILHKLLN